MKTASLPFIFLLALLLFVQPSIAETSPIEIEATRNLEEKTGTESFVNVCLNLSITENIAGLIVTEQIPTDFKFVNSTSVPPASAAKINLTTNEFKWLFISLEQKNKLTIQYTLKFPIEFNENSYTIKGNWKAVSTETEATGFLPTTEVQVEQPTAPQREPTTMPTYLIVGIGAVIVAVVVIVVMLARRYGFARS